MFSTVRGVESRLDEIVARRRAYVAQQTVLHYHALLSSLIQRSADSELCHRYDDEGCSTRLEQLLQDLADIDRCLDSADGDDHGWSDRDRDRDAVVAMAAELSLGWFAGSTTLCVAGQRTVVPNVADLCYQKLLLHDAAMSPSVKQLTVFDVDEQLNSTSNFEQPLPAAWSVPDVILAETAGHVYRLLHGLERCCSLDSPSCVLTGLVVYDRLCRLHQHSGPGAQHSARPQKVREDHQIAADPDGTQTTGKEGEKDQSVGNEPRPAEKSSPESDRRCS